MPMPIAHHFFCVVKILSRQPSYRITRGAMFCGCCRPHATRHTVLPHGVPHGPISRLNFQKKKDMGRGYGRVYYYSSQRAPYIHHGLYSFWPRSERHQARCKRQGLSRIGSGRRQAPRRAAGGIMHHCSRCSSYHLSCPPPLSKHRLILRLKESK